MNRRVVVLMIALALLLGITPKKVSAAPPLPQRGEKIAALPPAEGAVKVQAVASQGAATPGNNSNANVLVLVTDRQTGMGVVSLTQSDFNVVDHFGLPGQSCGFSGNITSFNNVGTGAYQITVATHSVRPPTGGCKWVSGDYLGQVIVNAPKLHGQAAFKLSVH